MESTVKSCVCILPISDKGKGQFWSPRKLVSVFKFYIYIVNLNIFSPQGLHRLLQRIPWILSCQVRRDGRVKPEWSYSKIQNRWPADPSLGGSSTWECQHRAFMMWQFSTQAQVHFQKGDVLPHVGNKTLQQSSILAVYFSYFLLLCVQYQITLTIQVFEKNKLNLWEPVWIIHTLRTEKAASQRDLTGRLNLGLNL